MKYILFLMFLLPAMAASRTDVQKNNFSVLHGSGIQFSLDTLPGIASMAPMPVSYTIKKPASAAVKLRGSFYEKPYEGQRVTLQTLPFNGDGISLLANHQYFSGYRYLWVEENDQFISPVTGGFYDLSALTLPSDFTYTVQDNNILTFSWKNPVSTGYGTKIVVREVERPEMGIFSSQDGKLLYSGNGITANAILTPKPGTYVHLAAFGMVRVGGRELDSGSGTQWFKNDAGVLEPIQMMAFHPDPDKMRRLVTVPVPRIDTFDKTLYRLRPADAPKPQEPNGQIIEWPASDTFMRITGYAFDPSKETVFYRRLDQNLGFQPMTPTRILQWDHKELFISLPSTLLTTRQACIDEEIQIRSGSPNSSGFVSNTRRVRIVNANPFYAVLCK